MSYTMPGVGAVQQNTGYAMPTSILPQQQAQQKYVIQPLYQPVANKRGAPAALPQVVCETEFTRNNYSDIVADTITIIQNSMNNHPLRTYMFNICVLNSFNNNTFKVVVEHVVKSLDASFLCGVFNNAGSNLEQMVVDVIADSTFCCAVTIYDSQIQRGDQTAVGIYMDATMLNTAQAGRQRIQYYAQLSQQAKQILAHMRANGMYTQTGTVAAPGSGVNSVFTNPGQAGVKMSSVGPVDFSTLSPERLIQLGLNPAKYIPGWIEATPNPIDIPAVNHASSVQPPVNTPQFKSNATRVFDTNAHTNTNVVVTQEAHEDFMSDFVEISSTFNLEPANKPQTQSPIKQETQAMSQTVVMNERPSDWKEPWAMFDPAFCESQVTFHEDGSRTQKIVYRFASMADFDPRLEMLDPFIEEYNKVHPEYHYVPWIEYNKFRNTMSETDVERTISANLGVISRRISPEAMENAKEQALAILQRDGEENKLQETLSEAKKVELEHVSDVVVGANVKDVATRSLTETFTKVQRRGRRHINSRQRGVAFETLLRDSAEDDAIVTAQKLTADVVEAKDVEFALKNNDISSHMANEINKAATDVVNDVLIGEFNVGWTIDSFVDDYSDLIHELKSQDGGVAMASNVADRITKRLSGIWKTPDTSALTEWYHDGATTEEMVDETTIAICREFTVITIDGEPGVLKPVAGSSTVMNVDRYTNPYLFEQLKHAIGDFDRKSTRNNLVQFTSGKLYRAGYNFFNQEVIYLSLVG